MGMDCEVSEDSILVCVDSARDTNRLLPMEKSMTTSRYCDLKVDILS